MKKKFDQRIIMRIEMVILIVITIIAITLTWFVMANHSREEGWNLQAHGDEYLKVALEPGGEDVGILTLSGNTVEADVQLPQYYDINVSGSAKKLMAPGVSGKIDLYITSLSPVVERCSVSMNSVPEYIDSVSANTILKQKVENLVNGHVQFYTDYDETQGTYSGLIGEGSPLIVEDLKENEERKVTLYWIWFYEYRDIPDEGRALRAENYFDFDHYAIAEEDYRASIEGNTVSDNSATMQEYITGYDYGDTKIGLSVKDLYFHLHVNALYGN